MKTKIFLEIDIKDLTEALFDLSYQEARELIKQIDEHFADVEFTEMMETYFVEEANKERVHEGLTPTKLGEPFHDYEG